MGIDKRVSSKRLKKAFLVPLSPWSVLMMFLEFNCLCLWKTAFIMLIEMLSGWLGISVYSIHLYIGLTTEISHK